MQQISGEELTGIAGRYESIACGPCFTRYNYARDALTMNTAKKTGKVQSMPKYTLPHRFFGS
jgi:hypothetical protein